MAQKGGKRPGAGKPKGYKAPHTLQAAKFREELIKEVIKEKKPIIKALIVECKKGNIKAIQETFDRVFGKSPESVEMSWNRETLETIQKIILKVLETNDDF